MVQPNVAEREEKIRDLKAEVNELDSEPETEVVFQHISPRRRRITVYSAVDGEPIPVPQYMIRATMSAVSADGKPRFVAKKADAPEYKLGDVKCFLHIDSPEREILAKIGLGGITCPAGHLASAHSKREHALHRHKQEWAAYQEFLNDKKEARREKRLDDQLEATLALAKGAAPAEAPAKPAAKSGTPSCQSCGGQIEGKLADHHCED